MVPLRFQSCDVPGVAALIANLVIPMNIDADFSIPWLGLYSDGCAFELYNTALAADFVGVKFSDAASVVYQGAVAPTKVCLQQSASCCLT